MTAPVKEIECIASRLVYENRWMRLREDHIRRRDGSEALYSVVEKPNFAVSAAIENGAIHLVEQYRYPLGGRFWELPQGSLENDADATPLEVARTELREETGLTARTLTHVGHLALAPGYSAQGYDIFLATGLSAGSQALGVEEQGLIARAFPLAEFERMIADGVIRDATTVAAFGLLRMRGVL